MSNDDLTAFLNAHMTKLQGRLIVWIVMCIIPLIVSGTAGVMAIRGDIKDGRQQSHTENVSLKRYVDSLHHDNKIEFKDLWKAIKSIDSPSQTKVIYRNKPTHQGYFTELWVNDKLVRIPVK